MRISEPSLPLPLSFFFAFPAVVADVVNVVVDVGCRLSAAVAVAVAILSDLMKYFAAYGTAPCLTRLIPRTYPPSPTHCPQVRNLMSFAVDNTSSCAPPKVNIKYLISPINTAPPPLDVSPRHWQTDPHAWGCFYLRSTTPPPHQHKTSL